jgi:regulator of sigma E protease
LDYILAFLAILTPVVFIHELGHYWVARKSGVVVEVFSIGFGPELFARTDKRGTRWRLAALPLGGYVKMRGDENAASVPAAGSAEVAGSFSAASVWARMAIVGAGPAANFLFGILLFAGVYMGVGKAFIPPIIGEIVDGSPAQQAGLETGDRVLFVDGVKIDDFNTLRTIVFENPERTLVFEIKRLDTLKSLTVTPRSIYSEQLKIDFGQLGVKSTEGEFRRLGVFESISNASFDTIQMTYMMVRGLTRLVTGKANEGEIGGPVRIAEFSADAARQGIVGFLIFMALISINLGLVNLIPIPALDGGHLLFFVIEAVVGRPLPEAIQAVLMRGGVALLLALMVCVTVYDIVRQFS